MSVCRLIMVLLLSVNASLCVPGKEKKLKKMKKVVSSLLEKRDKTPDEVKEVTDFLRKSDIITSHQAKELKKADTAMSVILKEEIEGAAVCCLITSCFIVGFTIELCAIAVRSFLNS